jgi:hypothetical protein
MNAKIVIAAAVLVLVASAAYVYTRSSASSDTTGTSVSANDLSVDIDSQYSSMIQEELDNLSSEQTAYNSQVQEDIADDLSVYYT